MGRHSLRLILTLPHARGGGPGFRLLDDNGTDSSPRTWGWTALQTVPGRHARLFPTHVGVDLAPTTGQQSPNALPHARGGGPQLDYARYASEFSSPRTWGWTGLHTRRLGPDILFPTHVGVDRSEPGFPDVAAALPHARGGGPLCPASLPALHASSPRTWGWTSTCGRERTVDALFPTHVGVDLHRSLSSRCPTTLPHARGGGPVERDRRALAVASSPRTWGWTTALAEHERKYGLFPTHVGVDPSAGFTEGSPAPLPHARGGGPASCRSSLGAAGSSPRTWGWTGLGVPKRRSNPLFPTHVGVDRVIPSREETNAPLPHARGGGPTASRSRITHPYSSPRTWGWTLLRHVIPSTRALFPTHVGVDPRRRARSRPSRTLPHARGGGPPCN